MVLSSHGRRIRDRRGCAPDWISRASGCSGSTASGWVAEQALPHGSVSRNVAIFQASVALPTPRGPVISQPGCRRPPRTHPENPPGLVLAEQLLRFARMRRAFDPVGFGDGPRRSCVGRDFGWRSDRACGCRRSGRSGRGWHGPEPETRGAAFPESAGRTPRTGPRRICGPGRAARRRFRVHVDDEGQVRFAPDHQAVQAVHDGAQIAPRGALIDAGAVGETVAR